jgi:DNA helicase HerA-like ATPase
MKVFTTNENLKFGKIIEVDGTSIIIEISKDVNELSRSVDGVVYDIGQIGSIIKVHYGRKVLFAYVKSLKMLIPEDSDENLTYDDGPRVIEADLFGHGEWDHSKGMLSFNRGVPIYPLPKQYVYLLSEAELNFLFSSTDEQDKFLATVGHYYNSPSVSCKVDIDKLFAYHCAVLGATGTGKSGTVAAILHSVLNMKGKNLKPRIVMIDPHGEYENAFREEAKVFKAFSEVSGNNPNTIKLPYWVLSSDELRALIIGKTEHEATSQNNMVYEAIKYARLINAKKIKKPTGEILGGEEFVLETGITAAEILNFDRDKPQPFRLADFIEHLEKFQGRKAGKVESLTASDDNRKRLDQILRKLHVLRSTPQLNFMMEEYDDASSPTLEAIIEQFSGLVDGKSLKIVDISGLPNDVAGLLTAVICRTIFQFKVRQNREEREKDPILLICEEAHRYVPNHGEAQYKEAQLAVRTIAKEGRKYGIGLMLISQRPSELDSTVLSQCNTWFILRLNNSTDINYVNTFLPDGLSGMVKVLSSLQRREVLLVGEAAFIPSRVIINNLEKTKLPKSDDISFGKGWGVDVLTNEEIGQITKRW